jgi:hypothetical protein
VSERRIVPPDEARRLSEAATEGPWEWLPESMSDVDTILQLGPEDLCVACFYGMDHIKSHPPDQANADLIAAAPDLAHTAAVLGEQRKAALSLHQPERTTNDFGDHDLPDRCCCCFAPYPCSTARALGVTE